MSLNEHVSITITQDSVGVARAGFGVPLILSVNAAWTERVRSYGSLLEVADDFATDSPEYLAANAIFSQSPHPERIMIGRAAGQPTQRYKVTASIVENGHTYKLRVKGEGFVEEVVEFTADSSATDGEIATGLVAALNAVTNKNFTASGSTSPISITGDAAGNWFSVESLEPAYLKIEQDHSEPTPTLAADLSAIALENNDWYALITLYNSDAYVKAAAAWVEANKKLYIADVSASETITLAASGGDLADDLHGLAYGRTAVVYHPSPAAMLGAAWLGARLPYDPGSETWKWVQINGVSPVQLTGTHKANLRAKKVNTLETIAGVNITWDGTTVDGDYIDVIRGLDWLEDDMQKSVFEALASAVKIPFTDAGVTVIEAAVRASLLRGVSQGLLAPDPEPVVTVPRVADVSQANKAQRYLPDVKFSATLAGAIHKVAINGVVSV